MVVTLMIFVWSVCVSAFQVFCGPNSNFQLSYNKTYNISIDNPPNSPFFIIGQQDKNASMIFNSVSRKLLKNFEIYSLSSYKHQLPYIIFKPISSNASSYYFTVCSFQLLITPPKFNQPLKIKLNEEACTTGTRKNHKKCICVRGYVGTHCDIKHRKFDQYDSHNTTSLPYTLKYFKTSSNFDVHFIDYFGSSYIFYGENQFPSFFEFKDYKVASYSGQSKYFSVFCGSEIMCKFLIEDKNSWLTFKEAFFYVLLVILICGFCGIIIEERAKSLGIQLEKSAQDENKSMNVVDNLEEQKNDVVDFYQEKRKYQDKPVNDHINYLQLNEFGGSDIESENEMIEIDEKS